ncbi:MAG: Peroxin/Dysferlin domain-containing protein [Piptocephalis tieghemiana]|nr:MAG: Peroxin/Dysferlin domain-containing protein [Piptocephalis tieghemiana]
MLPSDFFILSHPPEPALLEPLSPEKGKSNSKTGAGVHLLQAPAPPQTLDEALHLWAPVLEAALDIWYWRHPATSILCLLTWWGICWGHVSFFTWVLPSFPILWSLYAYWRQHYPAEEEEEEEDQHCQNEEDPEGKERISACLIHASSMIHTWVVMVSRELDWSDATRTTTHLTHLLYLLPIWMLWFHLIPLSVTWILVGTIIMLIQNPWVQLAWKGGVSRTQGTLMTHSPYTHQTMSNGTPKTLMKDDPSMDGLDVVCRLVENQRYWIGVGWSSHLLPIDPHPWQDMEGNEAPPPESYVLPGGPMTRGKDHLGGEGMIRLKWTWSSPWSISRILAPKEQETTDPEGWRYGDNFWRTWTSSPTITSYVRRRIWVRQACVASLEYVEEYEGELGEKVQ